MNNTPRNRQIAADYELWEEYADVEGLMSEEEFDDLTVEDKLAMLEEMFGPEEPEEDDR